MLALALCDDEKGERKMLRDYIDVYYNEKNVVYSVTEFHNAATMLASDTVNSFDAVFMDIYMGQMDGMTCAKKLRSMGYHSCFIFFTSSLEHVVDGFLVEALDYLVKPVSYERFSKSMERIMRHCEGALQSIEIMINGKKEAVYLRDLYFAETGTNHNTILHLRDGNIISSTLISDIDSMLNNYPNFLRCHRSFLINMNYIDRVEDTMSMREV